MNARICDRCGKPFSFNKTRNVVRLCRVPSSIFYLDDEFDLCPECISSFHKWIEDGKGNCDDCRLNVHGECLIQDDNICVHVPLSDEEFKTKHVRGDSDAEN